MSEHEYFEFLKTSLLESTPVEQWNKLLVDIDVSEGEMRGGFYYVPLGGEKEVYFDENDTYLLPETTSFLFTLLPDGTYSMEYLWNEEWGKSNAELAEIRRKRDKGLLNPEDDEL